MKCSAFREADQITLFCDLSWTSRLKMIVGVCELFTPQSLSEVYPWTGSIWKGSQIFQANKNQKFLLLIFLGINLSAAYWFGYHICFSFWRTHRSEKFRSSKWKWPAVDFRFTTALCLVMSKWAMDEHFPTKWRANEQGGGWAPTRPSMNF